MSFLSPVRYASFLVLLMLASTTLTAQGTAGPTTDSAESHLGKG
jgi:hypothetical protein